MVSNPVVLIFSEGNCLPEELAKSILGENRNTDYTTINLDLKRQKKIIGLCMNLSNKYFTTELLLVPFDEDIERVPLKLSQRAEAILVYFDSKDRHFRTRMLQYTDFLRRNNIELGVLICDSLCTDSKDGITYAEIKSEGILDVVEIGTNSTEAEICKNSTEAKGYGEICEIFNNIIWSNIKRNDTTALSTLFQREANENKPNSSQPSIENEFKMFEQLLAEVLSFRNSSEILPREERLIYAEELAKKFEPLIGELCSDDES